MFFMDGELKYTEPTYFLVKVGRWYKLNPYKINNV